MDHDDGCTFWDADKSGVLLTTIAYQTLMFNHSNAGTLRVLLENFQDQPSTDKTVIKINMEQLTENSPLVDYILLRQSHYPYLQKILQLASILSTDYLMIYSTYMLSLKISTIEFEDNLVNEMIELMKEFKTNTSNWISAIFSKHCEFVEKMKPKYKMTKDEVKLKIKEEKQRILEDVLKKLPPQESEITAKEILDFKHTSEELKAKILMEEIIPKLVQNEKPICFYRGKPILMKSSELIKLIYKLQYLDENKVQKLANIRTESDFLNNKLAAFIKKINYRHRWKDDELWYEWLKDQYVYVNFQEPEKREQMRSHSLSLSDQKTLSEINRLNLQQARINNEVVQQEIDNRLLINEIQDKNQLIHSLNIKDMLNDYAKNWKYFQNDVIA